MSKVVTHLKNAEKKDRVVVIGNFDGVHKGHQHLITKAVSLKERGGTASLLTFYPHPLHVLYPEKELKPLTRFADKSRLVFEYGLDELLTFRFNKLSSVMRAEEFIENVLVETLGVKHVVVGEGFLFGKKRAGDVVLLEEMSEKFNFEVHAVPHLHDENGKRYSSSRVRQELMAGDMDEAKKILGRPFCVSAMLFEDEMLNLIGNISGYNPIKNGVYWAEIVYDSLPHGAVIPVMIENGKAVIRPLPNLPDIPEGRVRLKFISRLNQSEEVRVCNE